MVDLRGAGRKPCVPIIPENDSGRSAKTHTARELREPVIC